MAGTAAIVGGVASAAGAVNSIAGGNKSSGTYGGSAQQYIPTNQPGVDKNLNSIYQGMQGPATSIPPQLLQQYQQLYSNVGPYQAGQSTTTPGPITSTSYFQANPDVGQSWQQLSTGGADPAAQAWFQSLPAEARTSPDAFAAWHYQNFGTQEGRQTGDRGPGVTTTTPATGNPYAQGQQTWANNMAGLGQQTSDFNRNLSGDLWTSGRNQYNFGQALQQPLVNAGNQQYGTATGLQGQLQPGIGGLMSAGQSVWNTALDPQQALYNRTAHQTLEQQNAINAMYGLGGSATGAGLAGDRLSNFNIDWQNQQLGRQLSGLQGMGNAYTQAGNLGSTAASIGGNALSGLGNAYTGASNIGSTGLQNMGRAYTGAADLQNLGLNQQMATGGLPYSTYMGQQTDQLGFLNALNSGSNNAFALPTSLANLYGNYLGIGNQATSGARQGQQQGFNQAGQIGQGLGTAIQGIGNIWGSPSTWFGGSQPSAGDAAYAFTYGGGW